MITLGEHDDAQVIFETLNAGGEPLAAMDLVRNDVFHRAARGGEDIESLMESRWRAFEEPFWKEIATRGRIKKPRIDFFLSDTLAAETTKEILLSELYARYKSFVKERNFPTVDAELELLLRHLPTYRKLVQPTGGSALEQVARHLSVFDVGTAYPLIFMIEASDAPEEDKAGLYKLILSYVVRRLLCGLASKAYNNVFLRIASQLRSDGISLENGIRAFSSLDGDNLRFPDDANLRTSLLERKLYGNIQQHRLRHILCELELAARDKYDEATSLPSDLTIEHVLPDAWMEHWRLPDGTKAPADLVSGMTELQIKAIAKRESLKHTLGNLTLLTDARNPSLGNLGFAVKRDKLKNSLLKSNQLIAALPDWAEENIQTRGKSLADCAVKLWPGLATSHA